MSSVSIVDCGIGNLGSMLKMFKYIGVSADIARTADAVLSADRVVLPGVGSFDRGISGLHAADLVGAVQEFALSGRPLLGVCLGMQLLTQSSEEGTSEGLGIVDARCRRLLPRSHERVPHMGWDWVLPSRHHPLMEGVRTPAKFYFAHSFAADCEDAADVVATTDFGVGGSFPSMIGRENVLGVQFHPEKSHAYGVALLEAFAGWKP